MRSLGGFMMDNPYTQSQLAGAGLLSNLNLPYGREILISFAAPSKNELFGVEHYSIGHRLCSHSRTSQHFMETEGVPIRIIMKKR
jgi:hypothetical protein